MNRTSVAVSIPTACKQTPLKQPFTPSTQDNQTTWPARYIKCIQWKLSIKALKCHSNGIRPPRENILQSIPYFEFLHDSAKPSEGPELASFSNTNAKSGIANGYLPITADLAPEFIGQPDKVVWPEVTYSRVREDHSPRHDGSDLSVQVQPLAEIQQLRQIALV